MRVVVCALWLLAALGAGRLEAREWSDKTGAHKTEAEFISFKNGKVYLEKPDGEVVSVPISILSSSDLEFLTSKPEVATFLKSHPELAPKRAAPSAPARSAEAPRFVEIKAPDSVRSGEIRRFGDLGWSVKSLVFSRDGGFLAVGKQDACLHLFDVDGSYALTKLDKLQELGQLTCCLFTPDNKKLIVGGSTGRIVVWEVGSTGLGERSSQFVGHNGEILTLAVSQDGKRVVSGGRDQTLKYWDIESGEEIHSFAVFQGAVKASFITPSGKQALGSDGASLILFDLDKGEAIQAMDLVSTTAHAVAISADGRKVAASNQYEIRVWDTKTGKGYLLQDNEIQWSLGFSADGMKIVSGGRAKVNVWDLRKKTRVSVFDTGSFAYVQTLACSPDNLHVAAIGSSAGQDLQVFRLGSRR